VGGDTLFEIGSTTKVFTTLLLAEMAERGDVALDDPIAKYLPPACPRQRGAAADHAHRPGHPHLRPAPMDPGFRTTDTANPRALRPGRGAGAVFRRSGCTRSWRAGSRSATSALATSTPTSASAFWATCWRCGLASDSRRCCGSSSPAARPHRHRHHADEDQRSRFASAHDARRPGAPAPGAHRAHGGDGCSRASVREAKRDRCPPFA